MNKEYVLVNFNMASKLYIDMIKINRKLEKIDELKIELDRDNEKVGLYEVVRFLNRENVILIDSKRWLSLLLKLLYENKHYDNFKFRYYDLGIDNKNMCILDRVKNIGIDNISFDRKIFRGLNYPKYLCDIKINNNKYYGYIVDISSNKYISYYAGLKEINSEYFNIDEIKMLKKYGCKIIMNVMYLSDESLSFVDYFFVLASINSSKVTKECNKLIKGIENFINYYNNGIKLKLILWGNLDKLLEQYKIIDKDILYSFIEKIILVKEPWDYFTKEDLLLLDKDR